MLGVTYKADENFVGGVTSDEGYNHKWILPNSEVFYTERWSNNGFKYTIPYPKDGKYSLILRFSEIFF